MISEHQQTAGAGKEAAGGSAADNYSPEPARARGADSFLLAGMASGVVRWTRGPGLVAVSACKEGFVTGEKVLGEPRLCPGLFHPAGALFPLGNACRVKGNS